MHKQKTLVYLVAPEIRELVNRRAAQLHIMRQATMSREDSMAEGDYQDATARLFELQNLINTIARDENALITRRLEKFNAEIGKENAAIVDYGPVEDFNIFDITEGPRRLTGTR